MADDRPSVSQALHQIIGESVLGSNNPTLANRLASLSPEERVQRLQNWILPNDGRNTIRLTVSLSTEVGVQSPVLDLISLATQLDRTEQLRTVVRKAAELPANARTAAAILFISELTLNDGEPTAKTIEALENFAALSDPQKVSVNEPDWPRLLVLSQATGIAAFDAVVTELLAPYYSARGSHFANNPTKDAFFDHIRWLDGRRIFAAEYGGKPKQFGIPPQLNHWLTTEYKNSGTRGRGAPATHWQITDDGVTKLGGHEMDYLMFRQPLHGDYVVEFDASAHSMSVVLAGVAIEFDRNSVKYDAFRNNRFKEVQLNPPLSKFKDWNRFRADVKDDVLQISINGRKVLTVALPADNDSWFGVRSWRRWRGSIRNFQVDGHPVVPAQIRLTSNNARNWTSYFEAGNWNSAVQHTADDDSSEADTIYGDRQRELTGAFSQSLFRYLRPLTEDGMIEYEFYYSDGEYLVHPALDRLCFVMTPNGIGVHTLTDQFYDSTGADPMGLDFDKPTSTSAPPLINDAWNRMQLQIQGETLHLTVNGTAVFSTQIPSGNDRTFGLFHYADQTAAKVRNVVWHGGWQRELPTDQTQPLRNITVEKLNQRSSELPATFDHDFRLGASTELFDFESIRPVGGAAIIEQVESGVRILRDQFKGQHQILANLQVQGDFDIRARFRDLLIRKTANGRAGVGLFLEFDSETLDDCAIYRRDQGSDGESSQRLQQAQKWLGKDGKRKFRGSDFPEESTAGCLRLVRRGRDIYYMYAEADSENFRIISQVAITDADTKPNGVSLVIQSESSNETTVTWESLSIRAQGFRNYWPDEALAADVIRRLDERRKELTLSTLNLVDEATVAAKLHGLRDESNGGVTDEGLRVTTTNSSELPGLREFMPQDIVDIEVQLDIHQIDAPTAPEKYNEVALLLYTTSQPLEYASIMLRRKMDGDAEVFCQTRESQIGGGHRYWPLRSLPVRQLKRMRFATLDGTLYYLYSETVDGPYQLLAEYTLPAAAVQNFLYLRSEANGVDSTVDVTWHRVSLFKAEVDNAQESIQQPAVNSFQAE